MTRCSLSLTRVNTNRPRICQMNAIESTLFTFCERRIIKWTCYKSLSLQISLAVSSLVFFRERLVARTRLCKQRASRLKGLLSAWSTIHKRQNKIKISFTFIGGKYRYIYMYLYYLHSAS